MNTETATRIAITEAGGARKVAEHFRVHRQAIYGWLRDGRVPAERVLELEQLCKAAVTRYQMRPDVYGRPVG